MDIHWLGFRVGKLHEVNASSQQCVAVEGYEPDFNISFFCFSILFKIIMAKPAGGPKPPSGKKDWDEDQND